MKKFIFALLLILISASVVMGDSYEAVTITAAAGGVSLTATTYLRARYAMCRLEDAEIRYTKDGSTAPTALVGILVEPFEFIILENTNEIRNFRGFKTGADASLKCFYMD